MYLPELLSGLPVESLHRPTETTVLSLEYDSRHVTEGALFFAIEGEKTDGNLYVKEAIQRGAVAVASERQVPAGTEVAWIRVDAIRPFMALVADRFHDHPSRKLNLVGITGTNGKTTTAFIVHSILNQRTPALLMGTVKTSLGAWQMESERTTPESIDVQSILARAVNKGCQSGVIEVSSHALSFYRVFQSCIPVAVFSNLSRDHLDFHGTIEEYFQAKCRLFQTTHNPGLRYAVVNADDPYSLRIPIPPQAERITFGLSPQSDVHPLADSAPDDSGSIGLRFFGRSLSVSTSLVGQHNLYNLMAAASAASLLGFSDDEICRGVQGLGQVPGRFERIDIDAPFTVIVDYAHTPHALENALTLARRLSRSRLGCVFGCGGDRDRKKRPLMGAIAARSCDWVLITSDNPRGEDPGQIATEIVDGISEEFQNYQVVLDRKEAIVMALQMAQDGDLVLIAGKGHETYQELRKERIHFDDREVVREVQ